MEKRQRLHFIKKGNYVLGNQNAEIKKNINLFAENSVRSKALFLLNLEFDKINYPRQRFPFLRPKWV